MDWRAFTLRWAIARVRFGYWKELLNSDANLYGGSGQGNAGGAAAEPVSYHYHPYRLRLTLPPLGMIFLKSEG